MRGRWLNAPTNASSPGSSRSAMKRSSAPRASTIGSPRMLSLMSSSTPTLTGVRLSENCVTGCRSPSSKTSKSSLVRPVIRRLLLSVTVTGISTVVTLPRKVCSDCAWPLTTKAKAITEITKKYLLFITCFVPRGRSTPSWCMSGARFHPRIVVLKRPHRQRLRPQRLDGADRGGRARECRDARHLRHRGRPPHRAIVEERVAAERRVDHEIDLTVHDLVGDVRPSLVD